MQAKLESVVGQIQTVDSWLSRILGGMHSIRELFEEKILGFLSPLIGITLICFLWFSLKKPLFLVVVISMGKSILLLPSADKSLTILTISIVLVRRNDIHRTPRYQQDPHNRLNPPHMHRSLRSSNAQGKLRQNATTSPPIGFPFKKPPTSRSFQPGAASPSSHPTIHDTKHQTLPFALSHASCIFRIKFTFLAFFLRHSGPDYLPEIRGLSTSN